jgi:hypothetical protein
MGEKNELGWVGGVKMHKIHAPTVIALVITSLIVPMGNVHALTATGSKGPTFYNGVDATALKKLNTQLAAGEIGFPDYNSAIAAIEKSVTLSPSAGSTSVESLPPISKSAGTDHSPLDRTGPRKPADEPPVLQPPWIDDSNVVCDTQSGYAKSGQERQTSDGGPWAESCFLTTTDNRSGAKITTYYYVSLDSGQIATFAENKPPYSFQYYRVDQVYQYADRTELYQILYVKDFATMQTLEQWTKTFTPAPVITYADVAPDPAEGYQVNLLWATLKTNPGQ